MIKQFDHDIDLCGNVLTDFRIGNYGLAAEGGLAESLGMDDIGHMIYSLNSLRPKWWNGTAFETYGDNNFTNGLDFDPLTGNLKLSRNGLTDINESLDGRYALISNVVPNGRTLTINGTSYDLSADRSWTIPAGPTYSFAQSLVNTAGTVKLVNDVAVPGIVQYYGTDENGTRGWWDIPEQPNNYPTRVFYTANGVINIERNGIADIASGAASGTWGISITGNAATVTNGVYASRALTINGTSYDLSADRSWTVGDITGAANLGTTAGRVGLFSDKSGASLRFLSLVPGTNLSFDTSVSGEVKLNATAPTVSAPAGQIFRGSGSGYFTDSNFTFDGVQFNLTANTGGATGVWKNLDPNGFTGLQFDKGNGSGFGTFFGYSNANDHFRVNVASGSFVVMGNSATRLTVANSGATTLNGDTLTIVPTQWMGGSVVLDVQQGGYIQTNGGLQMTYGGTVVYRLLVSAANEITEYSYDGSVLQERLIFGVGYTKLPTNRVVIGSYTDDNTNRLQVTGTSRFNGTYSSLESVPFSVRGTTGTAQMELRSTTNKWQFATGYNAPDLEIFHGTGDGNYNGTPAFKITSTGRGTFNEYVVAKQAIISEKVVVSKTFNADNGLELANSAGGYIRLGSIASGSFLPTIQMKSDGGQNRNIVYAEAESDTYTNSALIQFDARNAASVLANKPLFAVTSFLENRFMIEANGTVKLLEQGSSPGTPESGFARLYAKTDGKIYYRGAGGTEYDLTAIGAGTTYTFSQSLVNTSGTVTLVNDTATPGNSMYYGTNGAGTRGFYALPTVTTYTFSQSLVNTSGTVTLVNDTATPGNSMYYGTNGAGTRGFYALPAGGTTYTFSQSLVNTSGTVTLSGDVASPGNSFYYGTNGSGVKGFYALPAAGTTYTFSQSLVNTSGTVTLSGDAASPGNSFYYGTNASGVKGFYALPAGGTTYTFSQSLVNTSGTVTLSGDVASPGNSFYYGTNASGVKGWFVLPTSGGSLTITNNADNRVLTATGLATSINGEAGMTYDGSVLTISGRQDVTTTRGGQYTFIGRHYINNMAGTVSVPDYLEFSFGKAETTNNRASLFFKHVGDASANNAIGYFFPGTPERMRIEAGGDVYFPQLATTTGVEMLTISNTGKLARQALPYPVISLSGTVIGSRPTLNFIGNMSIGDNAASNRIDLTFPTAYDQMQNGGTNVTKRLILNFDTTGFLVTDEAASVRTKVEVNLNTVENFIAANVALTTANTFYTGPTISLTAGKWFVTANILVTGPSATAFRATARIRSSAAAYTIADQSVAAITGQVGYASITMGVILQLSATTSVFVDAASTVANSIMATSGSNTALTGSANKASSIRAVRIGIAALP